MIFTVTVKSQQKRVARVDACERVLLLLADSTEAPEKNMLHRDASYNNRMNGTCFTCEACAIDEIPTTPEVPHSGGEGCGLISGSYSCGCSTGYPTPTSALGSGFWVGLQQTSFYTNVPSGGWVVAVACGSGAIVGSFPTTGSSYGYGAGSILGVSVMIYPAGVVYGAGYVPANETTFPILALTPTEGNAIVSSGFNITTGALGCPANSNPNLFCPIGDSFGYVGEIVPCLSKFGGESGCALFDEFRANADGVDAEEEYGFNMGGTSFGGGELITGVVQFTNADGNQYCGAVNEGNRVPTDALSGLCGVEMWPDTVTEFFEEGCATCVADAAETNPIPCQYLNNLTNGAFNTDQGGYNSAGDLGFFGIGPSNPPIIAGGQAGNTGFWEQFWGWDTATGTTTSTPDGSLGVLPPISALIEECSCGENNASSRDFYTFIEKFECCPADEAGGHPEPFDSAKIEGYSVVKTLWAGLACGSCLGSLAAACSCPARNASESNSLRGSPGSYGYVSCSTCPCGGQEASQDPDSPSSGIWWHNGGMQPAEDPSNPAGAGACAQRCSNVIDNAPQCSNPCSQLTQGGLGGKGTQLYLESFMSCTGLSPQDFLDDPCSRSFFFPASLSGCNLVYTSPAVDSKANYVFLEQVTVGGNCGTCGEGIVSTECPGMCHPEDDSCYLNHTNGPLSNASTYCGGLVLGALTDKVIPTTETIEVLDCDGVTQVETEKLKFVRVTNQLCEGSGEDPCGCCSTGVGLVGPVGEESDAVLCGGGCGGCCSGAGCFDTVGGCSVDIRPGSKCGNTGGGGGSGGGGGPGGGSG